jgi:hypothetical protein
MTSLFSYYPDEADFESILSKVVNTLQDNNAVNRVLTNPTKLYDQVISALSNNNSKWPEYFGLLIIILANHKVGLQLIVDDDRAAIIAKNSLMIRGMIDMIAKNEDVSDQLNGIIPTMIYPESSDSMDVGMYMPMLNAYYYEGAAVSDIVETFSINRTNFYRILKNLKLPKRTKIPDGMKEDVLKHLKED